MVLGGAACGFAFPDFFEGVDRRGLLVTPGADYGDWVAPIDAATGRATAAGGLSSHVGLLISTAQLIEDLQLFVHGAAAMGLVDVATNYSSHRSALLKSFSRNFFNTSTGVYEDTCSIFTERSSDPTFAYSNRMFGNCLNGTTIFSFSVSRDAQCCSACSAFGTNCSGWTILYNGDSTTCQLLKHPLTASNSSVGCRSGVPNDKTAASGLQTLNSLALQIGAAPSPAAFRDIGAQIAHDAAFTNKVHITTGLVGTRYILPALTAAGQGEVAMQLVMQTEAPSWGYMVEGAAQIPGTIWETYSDLAHMSSSFNHPMFASFEPWFFETLGGLQAAAPGFSHSRVRPQLLGNLSSVHASIDTVAGLLRCEWTRAATNLTVQVWIPPNTLSIVTLPGMADAMVVKEGAEVVWERGEFVAGASLGVLAGAKEGHGSSGLQPGVAFDVGSGRYSFLVHYNGM